MLASQQSKQQALQHLERSSLAPRKQPARVVSALSFKLPHKAPVGDAAPAMDDCKQ
jgi:hypothetical protein